MALNASVLSTSLRVALLAEPAIQAIDGTPLTKMCDAIANAVVGHIQSAAVVTVDPGIAVSTSGGSGATTAPGTGTIS